MFNFEEYKKHLMNFYIRAYENNDEALQRRTKVINKNYTDKVLKKIIKDTEQFILSLVAKMAKERQIQDDRISFEMKLPAGKDLFDYISNGCDGGWAADTLFKFVLEKETVLVSKHLVEKMFGDNFVINVLSEDKANRFSISGPVSEFEKIC